MRGCLTLVGGVVVLVIVALVVIGINNRPSPSAYSPPSVSRDSAPPPVSVPNAQDEQNAVTIKPAQPAGQTPAVGGIGFEQQRVEAKHSLDELAEARSSASKAQATAVEAALERVRSSPQYLSIKADVAKAQARLDHTDADELSTERLQAARDRLSSRKLLTDMEREALSNDPDVVATSAAAKQAKDRWTAEDARIKAADASARADAKRAAEERQREIENDPVYKAIHGHYLIRGMNWNDAVEAIGKPYSISDAGYVKQATWEFGSGNFWSATFINGEIVETQHTRL